MGISRFEPNGPAGVGLTRMDLDPADFQSDLPEQHIHLYFKDEEHGISAGVWTTTDMQEAFGPYPGDEFMLVLEGRVLMTDGKGGEVPVETGQSFVIRNGIPVSWKQVGFLRKFFILYNDPNTETPEIASAEGGVIVPDPVELEAQMRPEEDSIGGGIQRDTTIFTNDAGNLTVGMWDTTAFKSDMQPFSVHEFAQILEGEVTVTEEDGQSHHFVAGDVLFVPKGTVCCWKSDGYLKKYYVTVSE